MEYLRVFFEPNGMAKWIDVRQLWENL